MHMEPTAVTLTLHQTMMMDWLSLRGLDSFVTYHLSKGDVSGYLAELLASENRQKTDDSSFMAVMASVADVQWQPDTTCKNIFDLQESYKRYLGVADDNRDFPNVVLAGAVENINDVLAKEEIWQTSRGSHFSDTDWLVITAAFWWLSEPVPIWDVDFTDLVRMFFLMMLRYR